GVAFARGCSRLPLGGKLDRKGWASGRVLGREAFGQLFAERAFQPGAQGGPAPLVGPTATALHVGGRGAAAGAVHGAQWRPLRPTDQGRRLAQGDVLFGA